MKTFVKTFICDYAEDIDDKVNRYAENNNLEIISISTCYISFTGIFYTTVIFKKDG